MRKVCANLFYNLFFSDTHEIVKIYNVFLVMYFASWPTSGIKLSVYERMFTTKCCQRDLEALLNGN